MPMVAARQGATILYPPDPDVAALFGKLGKAIEVEDVGEFDALSVVTATFATYFKYLDTVHAWLNDHGVPAAQGRDYIAALFHALGHAPELSGGADFMHLSKEYATRGGINEQVLRELTDRGLFDALSESLDRIHRRIIGPSDPGKPSPA